MKQICLGIDIIEIQRIRQAVSVWGERFLQRIYTERELNLYRGHIQSLAVRFAAKEALFKALNRTEQYVSWKNMEIISAENGRPVVVLTGEAYKLANELGVKSFEISLSHSRENAIAIVIGFGE